MHLACIYPRSATLRAWSRIRNMPHHPQLPEIEEGDDQRRDATLKRLLKTKPESREELSKKVRDWKAHERASSSAKKRGLSA
jgi:hypothetical protein